MDTKRQKKKIFDDPSYILIGNNIQGLLTKQLTQSLIMMVFIYFADRYDSTATLLFATSYGYLLLDFFCYNTYLF